MTYSLWANIVTTRVYNHYLILEKLWLLYYQLTGKCGSTSGKLSNQNMLREVRQCEEERAILEKKRKSPLNLSSISSGCFAESSCKFMTCTNFSSLPCRYGLNPLISGLGADNVAFLLYQKFLMNIFDIMFDIILDIW